MTQQQIFTKFPGYILFAIVDDPAQKPGWDILDVIIADRVEGHYEAVGVAQGCPSRDSGSYSGGWAASPHVLDGNRNFVVRKAQFLMGQKETNLVEETTTKVSNAEKRAWAAEEALKPVRSDLARVEARLKSMEEDRTRAAEERKVIVASRDKLEADMAKLKKMLGEKTVNDVLNPPTNG